MGIGSQGTSFQIGDLLQRAGGASGQPDAVVLDRAEDSGQLLVMMLPDGAAREVSPEEAEDWVHAKSPAGRWVEVYASDTASPFFAAYVPDISAAIAIYRAFEARDGDFKVEIYTNDDRENEMLDGIGYFGNTG